MDGAPEGTEYVETVVRFSDRPLDLLVETGRRRVLWTFRGRHSTTATRTGYFVADYQGENLFHGFERHLRSIHESEEWSLPLDGELRWDAGFHLWRVDPDLSGLNEDERAALFDALERDEQLAFGVTDYYEALAVVQAVAQSNVEITVGVASVSDPDQGSLGWDDLPIDLLMCPGMGGDFVPLTEASEEVVNKGDPDSESSGDVGGGSLGQDGTSLIDLSKLEREKGWSLFGQASLGLVTGLLVLSISSFFTPNPVNPITGLSAIGAFVGSVVGLPAVVHHMLHNDNEFNFFGATWSSYRRYPDWVAAVVAYGTLVGYLFPFGWKEIGRQFETTGTIFTSPNTLEIALPAAGLLLLGMVTLGWLVMQQVIKIRERNLNRKLVMSFAIGHFLYILAVLLATGLAKAIWFTLIPSAS